MKESGLVVLEMVLEFKSGLMEQFTKGTGLTTRLKGKENSHILMVTTMKEIGLMIRLMGMVFMSTTKLEQNTKVTGKTICSMVQA